MDVKEISEILYQYHSNPMGGHSGINNTLAKVSQYYTWNGMKEDVVQYVSNRSVNLSNYQGPRSNFWIEGAECKASKGRKTGWGNSNRN